MASAGELVLAAREKSPLFTRDRVTDRLCLDELSRLQQSYFNELADLLKDRLSQARTLATLVTGSLVGVDGGGNPYAVSTGADGYAVAVGADGVVYAVGPVISSDPYSAGFPLPSGSIQLIQVYATLNSGQRVPVHYLEQEVNAKIGGGSGLLATVNNWRLVPLKNPQTAATAWDQVTSVTVVWIDQPATLGALADVISIPVSYSQVLIFGLAAYLARYLKAQMPDFPDALVGLFEQERASEMARTMGQAKFDHRIIKERRMMRNR